MEEDNFKRSNYNVFVSHSSNDKPFVEKLLTKIKHNSVDIFYDKYNIKAGEIIPQKISEALEVTDFFLCILTKASISSSWAKLEWATALMDFLSSGSKPIIIPLLCEDVPIPRILKPIKYIDFRIEDKFDFAVESLVDQLGLNSIADDNRVLDTELFRMTNNERRKIFNTILRERENIKSTQENNFVNRQHDVLNVYQKREFDLEFSGDINIDAHALASHITKYISSHKKFINAEKDNPFVISVCGFPGLGKTTFSRELKIIINNKFNKSCEIIEFEKWMKDRSTRWIDSVNIISGFDIGAFNYSDLVSDVINLVSGSEILQPIRLNGETNSSTKPILPSEIIILDGVLSFLDDFNKLSHQNIYFDSDLATRYLLSTLKDYYIRGYNLAKCHSKYEIHNLTYPNSVQIVRNRAHYIVMSNPYHNYKCFKHLELS